MQDADLSYAGTLESIEMDDDFSTWTARHGNRPCNRPCVELCRRGPFAPVRCEQRGPNASGLSYLATGGGRLSDSLPSAGDDVLTWDDGRTVPIFAGSITIGGVSLNVLLAGPDERAQREPGGLEQVAELVPLPESSLALAATLWTVPSDSTTSLAQWEVTSRQYHRSGFRQASASSWVVFVTGMDEALKQTSRDIRDGIFLGDAHQTSHEGRPARRNELIELQGPILPAAQGGLPEAKPKLPRTTTEARHSKRRGRRRCEPSKALGQIRTAGSPSCWG